MTSAGNNGVLMHIQTGTMSVNNFHDFSFGAAGMEPLSGKI
jgi:hypothetical protein